MAMEGVAVHNGGLDLPFDRYWLGPERSRVSTATRNPASVRQRGVVGGRASCYSASLPSLWWQQGSVGSSSPVPILKQQGGMTRSSPSPSLVSVEQMGS